jgi:hypothetical protein
MAADDDVAGDRTGPATPTGVRVTGGALTMVASALLAAGMFDRGELPARLVVVTVAVAAYAAVVADWRAVAATTAMAVAVFVGFLSHRYGDLTHLTSVDVRYALVIGFACVLGATCRWMRTSLPTPGGAGAGRRPPPPRPVDVSVGTTPTVPGVVPVPRPGG